MNNQLIIDFLEIFGYSESYIKKILYSNDMLTIKMRAFDCIEYYKLYVRYNHDEWFAENEFNCQDEKKLISETGESLLEAVMKIVVKLDNEDI